MTTCNHDSDNVETIPLIIFLSFIILISVLYILFVNIHMLKKKSKLSNATIQCNLIKMQQIIIHPDESFQMIEQTL